MSFGVMQPWVLIELSHVPTMCALEPLVNITKAHFAHLQSGDNNAI